MVGVATGGREQTRRIQRRIAVGRRERRRGERKREARMEEVKTEPTAEELRVIHITIFPLLRVLCLQWQVGAERKARLLDRGDNGIQAPRRISYSWEGTSALPDCSFPLGLTNSPCGFSNLVPFPTWPSQSAPPAVVRSPRVISRLLLERWNTEIDKRPATNEINGFEQDQPEISCGVRLAGCELNNTFTPLAEYTVLIDCWANYDHCYRQHDTAVNDHAKYLSVFSVGFARG